MGAEQVEQLDLLKQAPAKCPLYGCRHGCSCSPEKHADTARRAAALEAKRSPRVDLPTKPQGGPGELPEDY